MAKNDQKWYFWLKNGHHFGLSQKIKKMVHKSLDIIILQLWCDFQLKNIIREKALVILPIFKVKLKNAWKTQHHA